MPAQFAHRGIAEGVVGDCAGHRRNVSQPRQRDRHVGFRAADLHVEPGRLQQTLTARGGEAKQEFAETYDPTGMCDLISHEISG